MKRRRYRSVLAAGALLALAARAPARQVELEPDPVPASAPTPEAGLVDLLTPDVIALVIGVVVVMALVSGLSLRFVDRRRSGGAGPQSGLRGWRALTFVTLGSLLYVAGLSACLWFALGEYPALYERADAAMNRLGNYGKQLPMIVLLVPFALPVFPVWGLYWLLTRRARARNRTAGRGA